MGKALKSIAIGAVIIGAAFVTGGASLVPTIAVNASLTGAAILTGTALATTALGGMALAFGAAEILSGISGAVAKKPTVSLSTIDRLNASLNPSAPRVIVFGRTAMGTDIRYVEPSGTNQEYIDYIIAVASHRVTSIEEIWLEDALAWSSSGGVRGIYAGFLTVMTILEGGPSAYHTVNGGARWGSAQRLTGCASIHLRIKRSGTNSPFTSGLPGRMTVIGKGMPLYDPRRDSTVPGGSGTMRAADQTTWSYAPGGTEIGQNLALQALAYELGWKINGKLAVGCGLPPARLDLAGTITAANLCDESVTTAAGSQPRYHGAGLTSEGDDPSTVLGTFATTCNGRFRETLGKLALIVMHNDLALAATDPGLGDDEMIGGFTWNPDPSLEQTYNIVRGRFTDPSTASLYQLVDYPEVKLASTDGIDRVLTLDLPWVQDAAMAQRLAKQTLERKQYQRTLSAVWNMAGFAYKVGDLVPVTLSALGFDRRLFRVEQQVAGFDGTCPMILTEENAAIYAWDADDRAPVTAADPITYNPLNNPILLAGGTANWTGVFDDDPANHPKPDDGATNSGDPNSPFGNGGKTVGQIISSLVDVDAAIAALQSDIANGTSPDLTQLRADLTQAQSDLQGIVVTVSTLGSDVDGANAAVTTEAGARANADSALSGRIDTVTSNYSTLASTVSSESISRSNADSALGARIDSINAVSSGYVQALVNNEASARASAVSAVTNQVNTLTSNYGSLSGTVSSQGTTLATHTNSIATLNTTLTSTLAALSSPNLLTNPSFTSGGFTGWNLHNTGAWSIVAQYNPTFAQQNTTYDNGYLFQDVTNIEGGKPYSMSFECENSASSKAYMAVQWFNGGSLIRQDNGPSYINGGWGNRLNGGTFTAPSGTTLARVVLFTFDVTDRVRVAKLQFQRSDFPTAYSEGSSIAALQAQVTTQAGTIADIANNKLGAYWQVTATAGTSSASISAIAQAGGSSISAVEIQASQFTIKTSAGNAPIFAVTGNDVVINGNLVTTGSIRAGSVAISVPLSSGVTFQGNGSDGDNYTPGAGSGGGVGGGGGPGRSYL